MPLGLGRIPFGPGRRGRGRGRGGGGGSFYAVFMAMRLLEQIAALEQKPPVTLTLVAVMAAVHFAGLGILGPAIVSPAQACFAPRMLSGALLTGGHTAAILAAAVARRAFWSVLVHSDDFHLLYNMSSFLYKGLALEPQMGSMHYSLLIAFIWITSKLLLVPLAWLLPAGLTAGCAVGWSGIIFGLKAIVASDDRFPQQQQRIFGIGRLPGGWVSPWLELLLISLMVPQASFVGHLAGLLAGLLWLLIDRFRVLVLAEIQRQREVEALAWRNAAFNPSSPTISARPTLLQHDQQQDQQHLFDDDLASGPPNSVSDADARRAAADAAMHRWSTSTPDTSGVRRRTRTLPHPS